MNLGKREIALGSVVIVLCAVAAVGLYGWFRGPTNNENFPEGTRWLCTNAACKNEFMLTMKQLSDHHEKHYGEPVRCPKCSSEAVRAEKCTSCGKTFIQQRGQTKCPYCGKELTGSG